MAHMISKRCTELFSTNSWINSKNILILFEEGPKTLVLIRMEKIVKFMIIYAVFSVHVT